MIHSLRWQFVVPRLLFVVVVLLAAQYTVGRIVRRAATDWLESASRRPVEVAHARVSLLNRELALSDLRIRSGGEKSQALVEVDRCELGFAVAPLLHKKITFEHGTLTGLRFNVPAAASARRQSAVHNERPAINWRDDAAATQARSWLHRLDQCFEQEFPINFASLEQTEQLWDRWPQQARHFDQRITALKQRAARLQQELVVAQVNPLRHVPFFDRLPNEVAELRAEFARAHADLEQLAGSFAADRRAILVARAQDENHLYDQISLEPIDANLLSAYLLREQVAVQLAEVISVLRWAREVVPAQHTAPRGPARGQDVLFAGCQPSPGVLVRNLALHGTARLGGQSVELRGTLSDITDAPALHTSPIRLRAKATGALPLEVQATIDRTGPVARDELLIDGRGIVVPTQQLGEADGLSLTLAPSVASLSVSVLVEGEKLSGDIQLVGRQVKITPVLSGQLSDLPLAVALEATLPELDALALRVSLGGTLSEPTCSLWSNLGPAVAEAMQRALHRAGDEHAQQLVIRARRKVDERLAGLEQQIQSQQTELTAATTAATGDLVRVAAQQRPAARITFERLGRRLPQGSLFR